MLPRLTLPAYAICLAGLAIYLFALLPRAAQDTRIMLVIVGSYTLLAAGSIWLRLPAAPWLYSLLPLAGIAWASFRMLEAGARPGWLMMLVGGLVGLPGHWVLQRELDLSTQRQLSKQESDNSMAE